MAFGLDDILWIIAGGAYVTGRLAKEAYEQSCDQAEAIDANQIRKATEEREDDALRMYNHFVDKDLEKICVEKSKRIEEAWRDLELFKRENPVWCYLRDTCENISDKDRSESIAWDEVGRIPARSGDNLVDMLMQTVGKREEKTLIDIVERYYACKYVRQTHSNKGACDLSRWRFEDNINEDNRRFLLSPDLSRMYAYKSSSKRLYKPWRAGSPNRLLDYLHTATGDLHETAVYDTGYEFDSSDQKAVRFIAWKAMEKAFPLLVMVTPCWVSDVGKHLLSYCCEKPTNGSVVSLYDCSDSTRLNVSCIHRVEREDAFVRQHGITYVPHTIDYARIVLEACYDHKIKTSRSMITSMSKIR